MDALDLAKLIWQNYDLACTVIRLNQPNYLEKDDPKHREIKERQLLEAFKNER